jgi:hypothetical protein
MYTLVLNFNNIGLKVTTNDPAYNSYLRLYFARIISLDRADAPVDIELNIIWEDKAFKTCFRSIAASGGACAIGANTWLNGNRMCMLRKVNHRRKVAFDVLVRDGKIRCTSLIQRKALKDFFRYTLLHKPREEWFFALTYPCLYYPLLWYLEYFKSIHALHASGLYCANKGVILCGLEGIGKTSLALSLLDEPGAFFISDNLILYDDQRIYPCYELIRIHKDDDPLIWRDKFEKVNAFKTLKDFYQPAFDIDSKGIKPDILIFPCFSSRFFIEELKLSEAANTAIALSYLPAELNTYFQYRNLYNMFDAKFDPSASQGQQLTKLLGQVRCFKIGMPRQEGLEANAKKVRDFIKSA